MNWWGGTFVDCAWPLSWSRSAGLISRLKTFLKEKYYSNWKNKLKSTDYKPDEQALVPDSVTRFILWTSAWTFPPSRTFCICQPLHKLKFVQTATLSYVVESVWIRFTYQVLDAYESLTWIFFRSLYIKEAVIKKVARLLVVVLSNESNESLLMINKKCRAGP
jgi:hypothetical protein